MSTDAVSPPALLAQTRLLQLVSPSLPVGAFTYSQGLEWAVEAGWVHDVASLEDWLVGLLDDSIGMLELPILARLQAACACKDVESLGRWAQHLLAARETDELRREERNRARALTNLLRDLEIEEAEQWREALLLCQAAPFGLAMTHWNISKRDGLLGYAWGWIENQVAAAIKLVPLGQTSGQRVQLALGERLPAVVERALSVADADIGSSAPALAVASSRHETQYTRLFRS